MAPSVNAIGFISRWYFLVNVIFSSRDSAP
jgi:hypothetical protein